MVSKPAFVKQFAPRAFENLDLRQSRLFGLLCATAAAVPVSIAAAQILLAATTLYWSWQVFVARVWKARTLPFLAPLLFCFLTTLLAVLLSPDLAVSAGSLKKFALFVIPFVAVSALRGEEQVRVLLGALFVSGAASAAWSFWQYPDAHPLDRVSGFLGHWQTFAGQQMILLVMLGALLLLSARRSHLLWACVVLSAGGLLLSETRGAWLGAGAALALLAFVRDRRLPLLLAPLLLVFYLVLPVGLQERARSIVSTSLESNAARLNMWSTGLNIIRENPWTGIGPSQISLLAYQYGGDPRYEPRFYTHLHNNFLQLAAERGLPGLAAWLWLLFRFFADSTQALRRRPVEPGSFARPLCWGVTAALVAVLVAGLVEFNLGDSEVLMLLLFLLACVYARLEPPTTRS